MMKWTIRKKFFIGFLLLFTLAAFSFYQIMENTIESNTTSVLENDLTKLQHTSKEYIKQFSRLQGSDEKLFAEFGSTIAQELSNINSQSISIYDADGSFLNEATPIDKPLLLANQKYQESLKENSSTELTHAFQNKAAYTLETVSGGTLLHFAYPVYIEDTFYGVLKFTGDYSAMFKHNQQLLNSFTLLSILLFVGVFVISLLLTNQLIKPLHTLSNATKQIAKGNYRVMSDVHTSDEIGELAKNFQLMQNEIQQQMHVIKMEKEKVLLLEKKRTDFFHNVTHELKTPLTTISGYAQIIGEKQFDDPLFLEKAASRIHSESDRLNNMVVQLLSFSKAQADLARTVEVFDLFSLIESVSEDIKLEATDAKMPILLTGQPFSMEGNPDEMRQVILNVLSNAIKHGKPNRAIEIHIEKTIIIKNYSDLIPQKIIQHAFEPFVHGNAKDSHGLGLFICEQIISKHQGTISFAYKDEQAIIEISLPQWQQNGNNFEMVGNNIAL